MITRRGLFKGLAATIGTLVLKPFVKAETKSIDTSSYKGISNLKKTYIDKSILMTNKSSDGWFKERYINNWEGIPLDSRWIHGSNSIDDVHFEVPDRG